MAKIKIKKKAGITAALAMASAGLFLGANNESEDQAPTSGTPIIQTVDDTHNAQPYYEGDFTKPSETTVELDQALIRAQNEREALEKRTAELEEENQITSAAHLRQIKKNKDLEAENTELIGMLEEQGSVLFEAQQELIQQKEELAQLNSDREKLLEKCTLLEEELKITEASLLHQAGENLKKGKQTRTSDETLAITEASLLNQSAENLKKQKKIQQLKEELAITEASLLNQAGNNLKKQEKIAQLKEELAITEASLLNQAGENLKKQTKIDQLKEELTITNLSLLNQSRAVLEKEKAIKKKETEITALKEELAITNASLQHQAAENIKKGKQIQSLEQDLIEQGAVLFETGNQLLKAQEDLSHSIEERETLKQKAAQLELQLKQAEEEALKRANTTVEQAKQINALKFELLNTNKKLITSMKEQLQLNEKISTLQEQLDIVSQAHQRRTAEAEQVKKENKGLKQQLEKIKAENKLATTNVPFNPFNYVESGQKMGVAIYTQLLEDGTEIIKGVESCTIGSGGYSGCDFSYASSGDTKSHEHFRDNIHVTRATGSSRVIAVNADGKFQKWERGEYSPDEHYEKVIRLTGNGKPITAIRVQEQTDGTYKYLSESNKGVLKQAMERLEAGTKATYFVNRYNSVSRER